MTYSNWLTDDQLRELLDRYFEEGHHKDEWIDRNRELIKRIQTEVLNREVIESLPDDEFIERSIALYREIVTVPMYYKAFRGHTQEVRNVLMYLLESDDELSEKVDAVLETDGKHRITGLGRAFWSYIFMALSPDNNPNWNDKTEAALQSLGMNYWDNRSSLGERYQQVAIAQSNLASLSADPGADLFTIDHFMHFVTNLEGKTLLEQWLGEELSETISTVKAVRETIGGGIAEPLASIFSNREEAEWAFDLLAEILTRLDIHSADDPRWAITLTKRYGGISLHLTVGNWLILGFRPTKQQVKRVRLIFIPELVDLDEEYVEQKFITSPNEPRVWAYGLPIEMVMPLEGNLRESYLQTLDVIAERFAGWNRSLQRGIHVDQIAEAVFDPSKREPLFLNGLSSSLVSVVEDELEELELEEIELAPEYSLAKCAEQTGIKEDILARWTRAVERKKQAIFYGPPGTGKTFIAEHLARHLIGGGDGFVDLVQFHPAYAYEDFIQGIRPESNPDRGLEYPVVPGRFLQFCRKAEGREGLCVLIIDEINRANLARVFGELMYLLEYREREIPLAGGGRFRIPDNVRMVGTMNTADRSIALVDHALRRRFAFLALYPDFDILRQYHRKHETGFPVESLISVLERLNRQIGDRHYEVGISFFLREDIDDQIEDVWRMEIEPYLEEYFFDQSERVASFRWDKIGPLIES
jgi:MoxR-like ATPase